MCLRNYWHVSRDLTGIGWQVWSNDPGTAYAPSWKQAARIRHLPTPPAIHVMKNFSIRQKLSENNEATMNMESGL